MKLLFNPVKLRKLVLFYLLFFLPLIAAQAHACELKIKDAIFSATKNTDRLSGTVELLPSNCGGRNWSVTGIKSASLTFGSGTIVALFYVNGAMIGVDDTVDGRDDNPITVDVYVGKTADVNVPGYQFLNDFTSSGSFEFNLNANFSHAPSDGGTPTAEPKIPFVVRGEILTSCEFSSTSFTVNFGVVSSNKELKKQVSPIFYCTTASVQVVLTSQPVSVSLSGGGSHVAALYKNTSSTEKISSMDFINGLNLTSSSIAKEATVQSFEVRVGSGTVATGVTGIQSGTGTFKVDIPITIAF